MKQNNWNVGQTVNVGFVRGLTVLARIPTPGNGAPDEFALANADGSRFYRFTPHFGLSRVADHAAALDLTPSR